ncbi:hypothetical protein [Enterobacter asburiae]|uniref:hypothetical protein n=1 Tax=Enterobacter asburiae TaxID=61645 RepID=UPI00301D4C1D
MNEEGWGQLDFWKEYFVFLMMMLGLAFIFTGAIAIAAYKSYFSTCCKLTEEIFQLLEMKDVTRVNLKEITNKREKLQRKKGKWHEPSSRSHTPRPTRKFGCLFECWCCY